MSDRNGLIGWRSGHGGLPGSATGLQPYIANVNAGSTSVHVTAEEFALRHFESTMNGPRG